MLGYAFTVLKHFNKLQMFTYGSVWDLTDILT